MTGRIICSTKKCDHLRKSRRRTAARLWTMRRHLRLWIEACGYNYEEASRPGTQERLQAVQKVRDNA